MDHHVKWLERRVNLESYSFSPGWIGFFEKPASYDKCLIEPALSLFFDHFKSEIGTSTLVFAYSTYGSVSKTIRPALSWRVLARGRGEAKFRRHPEGANAGTHSDEKGWADVRATQSAWWGGGGAKSAFTLRCRQSGHPAWKSYPSVHGLTVWT